VTLTGSKFQRSQGTSTVTFNGVAATPTTWTEDRIVVAVPPHTATGSVVVTVNSSNPAASLASNAKTFTVTLPSVGVHAKTVGPLGSGTIAFTVQRTTAVGNLNVVYQPSGSAVPGTDYQALPGSVSMTDGGVLIVTIPIHVLPTATANRTLKLTLTREPTYAIDTAANTASVEIP
jgi:hypothetical protein